MCILCYDDHDEDAGGDGDYDFGNSGEEYGYCEVVSQSE
jgi:hypothetical protein